MNWEVLIGYIAAPVSLLILWGLQTLNTNRRDDKRETIERGRRRGDFIKDCDKKIRDYIALVSTEATSEQVTRATRDVMIAASYINQESDLVRNLKEFFAIVCQDPPDKRSPQVQGRINELVPEVTNGLNNLKPEDVASPWL